VLRLFGSIGRLLEDIICQSSLLCYSYRLLASRLDSFIKKVTKRQGQGQGNQPNRRAETTRKRTGTHNAHDPTTSFSRGTTPLSETFGILAHLYIWAVAQVDQSGQPHLPESRHHHSIHRASVVKAQIIASSLAALVEIHTVSAYGAALFGSS
jgi:hypothetical protein